MVAGFNACSVVGRIIVGFVCDGIGSTIVLLLTTVFNSFSMLAIWRVSETVGSLAAFTILDGLSNGSFLLP